MAVEIAGKSQTFVGAKRLPATRRERWAWYLYDLGGSAMILNFFDSSR